MEAFLQTQFSIGFGKGFFFFSLMISVQNKDDETERILFPSRGAVFIAGTEVVISVIICFELQAGLLFLQGLFFLKRLAPAAQAGLKAVFESFAHQIQSDWIDAGI